MVFLAVVDADYKFTYIDVGTYSSSKDAAIFQHRKFFGAKACGIGEHLRPFSHRGLSPQKHIFSYRLLENKWRNTSCMQEFGCLECSTCC